MLNKFLKEVIALVVGRNVEDIVDLLDKKKHVNEFLISKKLDLTINQTRNILYKISDQGLVSSIRKKDKRKGWYTYFWKIEILKSLEFLRADLSKRIEQLESQVRSRETKRFYVCETCHIEMTEENSLACDFTCNECGGIFTLKDNEKLLKGLKKNLQKIEEEISEIDKELDKELETQEKAKKRMLNKEEKEKEKKKKEASEKRKTVREAKRKALGLPPIKNKIAKKKTTKKKAAKKKTTKKTTKKKTELKKAIKKKA